MVSDREEEEKATSLGPIQVGGYAPRASSRSIHCAQACQHVTFSTKGARA